MTSRFIGHAQPDKHRQRPLRLDSPGPGVSLRPARRGAGPLTSPPPPEGLPGPQGRVPGRTLSRIRAREAGSSRVRPPRLSFPARRGGERSDAEGDVRPGPRPPSLRLLLLLPAAVPAAAPAPPPSPRRPLPPQGPSGAERSRTRARGDPNPESRPRRRVRYCSPAAGQWRPLRGRPDYNSQKAARRVAARNQ